QPADELDEVRKSCAGLQGTVLSVRLRRMDRKEMNDIRSRVQGREVDREIAFYCECPDPNCRAAVALPASALADLRPPGIPALFPASVPDEEAPPAGEQGFESRVIPPGKAAPPPA